MQKKLIAAVVAGIVSSAPALAEITVYGVVDVGVESVKTETAASSYTNTRVTSGLNSGSRIGFKGSEDLGGGLKAGFVLENGFRLDTGALKAPGLYPAANDADRPKLFDRQAYAYLAGGFGQVALGRQYSPMYFVGMKSDPTALGFGGVAFSGWTSRIDNMVQYTTPTMNGVSASVGYTTGRETASSVSDERNLGAGTVLGVSYAGGPLYLGVAYNDIKGSSSVIRGKTKGTLVGAAYDFNVAKVYASWSQGRSDDRFGIRYQDEQTSSIGLSVPVSQSGSLVVLGAFTKDKRNLPARQDAKQYTVGYTYSLSKRTSLFAGYAVVKAENGRVAQVSYADATAIPADLVYGENQSKSIALGVRHFF